MTLNTFQPLNWNNVSSTGAAISYLSNQTHYVIVKGAHQFYACLDGPGDSDRVILGTAATRAAGKRIAQRHYDQQTALLAAPSNAPLLIGVKGTWVHEAPFEGSGGYLSSSSVSDALTPENAAMYLEKDHRLVDQWSIYYTPDRTALFTVNMDGTLRSWMQRKPGMGVMRPHPNWAA